MTWLWFYEELLLEEEYLEEYLRNCGENSGTRINTEIQPRTKRQRTRRKHGRYQKGGLGAQTKTTASNDTTRPESSPSDNNG